MKKMKYIPLMLALAALPASALDFAAYGLKPDAVKIPPAGDSVMADSVLPRDMAEQAASAGIVISPAMPAYNVLAALFEQGAPLYPGNVNGWAAGREFTLDKPNTPYPALFVGTRGYAPDYGELLTGTVKIMLFNSKTESPLYFDSMNSCQLWRIKQAARATYYEFPAPQFGNEVVVSYAQNGSTYRAAYRRYGKYVLLKWDSQNPAGLKSTDYAYFFKNVTPKGF